jgi:hypothetical protein
MQIVNINIDPNEEWQKLEDLIKAASEDLAEFAFDTTKEYVIRKNEGGRVAFCDLDEVPTGRAEEFDGAKNFFYEKGTGDLYVKSIGQSVNLNIREVA